MIVLIVIAAILLALIVLIQESKGGGLASGFAASNAIMGVRRTTDLIEKFTWGLAIAIVVLSVASSYFLPTAQDVSVVMKPSTTTTLPSVPNNNAANPATLPGTAQPTAPAQAETPADAAPQELPAAN